MFRVRAKVAFWLMRLAGKIAPPASDLWNRNYGKLKRTDYVSAYPVSILEKKR